MKTNEELQKDVQDAIKWEPLLKAAEIGVTAKDGVITLSGTVDSYAKKSEAEAAAKTVAGVKVVVEQIEIKTYSNLLHRDDNDLANEVLNAYKWNWEIPNDKVKVKVENGWITLEGAVEWNYQREAAERLIKKLAGIKGISNLITINTEVHDEIEKMGIESALGRNWSISKQNIHVKVVGTKVTLTGTVDSWYQKEEAGRIAWNAPGVVSVDNELLVEYAYSLVD
ncbi:BON domain-containing protein [Dyadobacter frigoris]|uniref:BON domain-containing protein n=1 Tax=Dyadobacter frigoris TaxID=2576211 RepID=A0A4U6D1D0_9BACT|nr:BON domain-containing protein [Dyadobacter frigoris]TKT90396.1 BON domain-containing protein [Dyadobacter frigoris]GLU57271.1 ornithine aminotransferase [Dyadobacter frigoris]